MPEKDKRSDELWIVLGLAAGATTRAFDWIAAHHGVVYALFLGTVELIQSVATTVAIVAILLKPRDLGTRRRSLAVIAPTSAKASAGVFIAWAFGPLVAMGSSPSCPELDAVEAPGRLATMGAVPRLVRPRHRWLKTVANRP